MRSYKFKRWILLFSHTGGEAATIVEHLYHTFPNPIHIITNQTDTEAYTKNFPVCIESHIGDPIENKEYLEEVDAAAFIVRLFTGEATAFCLISITK